MDSRPEFEQKEQVNRIVEAALTLAPGERTAYLDNACTDEALRRAVETTMAMRDVSGRFGGATNAEGPTAILQDAETVGVSAEEQQKLLDDTQIGPYRVLRRIGQGGMGAVYLAARGDAEFRRQVAIKLVKRGMDTEFVLRRFRNERQILAALDHPNIARLLDGGTTADGRPYFVMEYIEGKPITEYADGRRLSTAERLRLFQEVCAAVHYAHQNLVIHRDLKPSNILVTNDGTPKLLDFGIAKLLNPELAAHTIEATAVAVRLMTPEYASPEQVKGDAITTASDVYSLGVLLYELLTGHRPYRINSRAPHEVARVVCEEEPQKPSTAVARVETYPTGGGTATVTVTPEVVSRTRDGNPDKLRRRLAGDLDNIVLMAMRKEPQRRYASVDQLANDIRRHLEGRPVIARHDTIAYRTAKFVKRHKAGVLAALLILASLVTGAVTTLQQRARAERRFNDVRQLANSFLFEFHDAIKDLPGSTPARELVVKRALDYLDGLAREAGNDAQLQRELATAYQKVGDVQGNPLDANLGDTSGALASYQKALAIREGLVKKHPASVEDRRDLATSYIRIGDVNWRTGDVRPALEAYRQGVSIGEALLEGDQLDLPASRELWRGYRNLAYTQATAGDFAGGLETLRKAQALGERLLAAHPDDAGVRNDMSMTLTFAGRAQGEMGDLAGALETFQKALAINERLAAAEPNRVAFKKAVASNCMDIGDAHNHMGNARAAAESYRRAYAIMEQVAAADPADVQAQRNVASAQINLGGALVKLGRFDEALEAEQRAVAIYERIAAGEPANEFARAEVAYAGIQVSYALAKIGKGAQALEAGERARATVEAVSAANPTNAEFRGLLASTYTILGDIHVALATGGREAGRQAEHLRAARDAYQRGYEMLKGMKDRGEFATVEYGTPEAAAAKLAECDALLAKLKAR
ncbi:MAG TPA: serine/threonine-protein kinase [Blastocatellia bacterium]|nr:serine/threonine-protein kinase [Blastocatellia bacterium]